MGSKPSNIKLCSIVKAELLYGASRSNNVSAALARLETFFAPYASYRSTTPRRRNMAAFAGIWPALVRPSGRTI
ncbi:MAG: hypothetical protein ABSH32_30795 [Bryobacteraceae bacterium]